MSHRGIEKYKLPFFLIALHIPLGLLLYSSSVLAFLHPVAVLGVGLYWAIRKTEKLHKVAWVCAYIVGAEVLWRMADSRIYWESGKYSIIAIMVVALAQRGFWKIPKLPLAYLFLLLPACVLTVVISSLGDARDALSFNMSGPLLLFVSCWFFSHLRIPFGQVKTLLMFITLPLISIGVTTLFYAVTIENIQFSGDSNFLTSGGFGPNQVSSILGLGVFVCLASYFIFKNKFQDKVLIGLMAVFFSAQSILTFSRGGMYNAVGALVVLILILFRDLNRTTKRLLPVIGLVVLFLIIVFPFMNDFTGGNLQSRFEDTEATGRTEIIEADFNIFLENPVLGSGVGRAKALRERFYGKAVGAHTEFSRVIAEHGTFGLLSLAMLVSGVFLKLKYQKHIVVKALFGGAVIWSLLFMVNAGMRIAAPSFMLGICFVSLPTLKRKRNQRQRQQKLTDIGPEIKSIAS